MARYRRSHAPGAMYFFTVTLEDRKTSTRVDRIVRRRAVYRSVAAQFPFSTDTICVGSNHLHAIRTLTDRDADFAGRWNQSNGRSSLALEASKPRMASP